MSDQQRRLRGAGAMAALLLVGCSGAGVATPDYQGAPLVTLHGQLQGGKDVDLSGGVRMALAWYPPAPEGSVGMPSAFSQPSSIVAEDMVFEGAFPLDYQLSIFAPPPPTAMADFSERGGPARAAVGVLLAYRDLNGNGRLDPIPADGTPIDKVVGASADLFTARGIQVVYVEPDSEQGLPPATRPGFNLASNAEALALDAPIFMDLRDDPTLDLFVCDAWVGNGAGRPDPCGISLPAPLITRVSLLVEDDAAFISIQIKDMTKVIKDAQVVVEGRVIPFDAESASYYLYEPRATLIAPGKQCSIEISVEGRAGIKGTLALPGELAILEPADRASLAAGSTATVRWSASQGADSYRVRFLDGAGDEVSGGVTEATSLALHVPNVPGPISLVVEAMSLGETMSSMVGGVAHSRELLLVAP